MTYYPFLKWAGGKRWLTPYAHALVPPKFETYFEPFLGAGAMFGALAPKRAVLSDCNADLINCFLVMRDESQALATKLQIHHECHSNEYYYSMRSAQMDERIDRAARFLYLNRTCFNGIYRVNQKGQFNVPIGTKSSVVFKYDDFDRVSELLKYADIRTSDFSDTIELARSGDFVFCDPPYTVAHNNNGFVRYNEKMFSWNDQIRLRAAIFQAHERGVQILMTNAAHYSLGDLYGSDEFFVTPVSRAGIIGGGREYRGKYSEFLISNYRLPLFTDEPSPVSAVETKSHAAI